MAKKPTKPAKGISLRQRAEARLRTTASEVDALSTADVRQLVHELQVHQVELEMQNEELRRTQMELEATRDRYANLYAFSPAGHLTLDARAQILEANHMAATLAGLTRRKLCGTSLASLIAREDQDVFHQHVQQVLKGDTLYTCEMRLRKEPGMPCWVLFKSLAIPDESGRITQWQTAFLDITDRKVAEAALRELNATLDQRVKERTAGLVEANERWTWVVRATNDGVWDWDLVHDTAYYSPRWKAMHGFPESDPAESVEEWLGRIHSDDRPRVVGALENYLAGKREKFWEEYRIRRKDGAYVWVLDRGMAVFTGQGRAIRMVGAETDITWHKEAEEELRRQAQEFHALADNVPACFAYIDQDRRYCFVNKQYEDFWGRSSHEIKGALMRDLHSPEEYTKIQPRLDRAFAGEPVAFEYELPSSGSDPRWFSAQYVPERDAQGKVAGLFVLLVDITTLKLSESMLRERELQLQSLSAQLLQVQEEERRRIARDLHDDVMQRLAALTLELHRLSSVVPSRDSVLFVGLKALEGRLKQVMTDLQQMAHRLHPSILEHVGLEAAARELVDDFAVRTGVLVELMTRGAPMAIPLDQATCLYRVLQEGLENVRKHANATTVLVRLLRTGRGIGVCVHDDGCGIKDSGGGAHHKGLGLTGMRERVAMLQGTFRLKTKPGAGTEIHAWVPLDAATARRD